MRLLSVTFENLNSLRGQHTIDFRQPCFNAGLFAIVGDTGAGKSTILDAVCLALYHQTPRLGLIASDNQIMSRGTGECMAEIEFETIHGSFRASWHQHRARRKSDGKLANATCNLAYLTGEQITDKVKDKLTRIVEIVGLSYDQFTRSVLLSQGEFSRFLTADEGARADLLEKLTGTEVYAGISRKIYAKAQEAATAVAMLKAEAGGIELLTAERRAEFQESSTALQREVAQLRTTLDELRKDEAWRSNVHQTRQALLENEKLLRDLQGELEAQTPLRDSIRIALQAERLRPLIDAVDGATARIQRAADHLFELQGKRSTRADDVSRATWRALQVARREQIKADLILEQAQADIRLIDGRLGAFPDGEILLQRFPVWRELAGQLRAARLGVEREAAVLELARRKAEEAVQSRKDLADKLGIAKEDLNILRTARDGAARALVNALQSSRIEELRIDLGALRTREARLRAAVGACATLEAAQKDVAEQHIQITCRGEQLQQLEKDVAEKQAARELAQDCWKLQRQRRELALEIRSLEDHRTRLTAGEPCVLCGALEHPYADPHAVPGADEAEQASSKAERDFNEKEKAFRGAANALMVLETEQKAAQRIFERSTIDCDRKRGAWQAACTAAGIDCEEDVCALADITAHQVVQLAERIGELDSLDSAARRAADALAPVVEACQGLEAKVEVATAAIAAAKENVDTCCNKLHHAIEAADTLAKRLGVEVPAGIPDDLDLWLSRCEHDLDAYKNLKRELATKQDQLPKLHEASTAASQQEAHWTDRWLALGNSDRPEAPESGIELSECVRDVQGCELAARDLETLIESLKVQRGALEKDMQDAQLGLQSRVSESDFEGVEQCRAALVDSAELEAMQHQVIDLDRRIQTGNGAKDAVTQTLDRLMEQARTEASVEEIGSRIADASEQLEERVRASGHVDSTLAMDRENRKRLAGKEQAIADAEEFENDWSQMNDLVGSASGTKFRKFAQGLTLDRLVELANTHLFRLEGGRYRICRGESLDLRIIDGWDADAERDAKTLSGGESFQVSLSLALALSDLVSHKTSIDTFLLDEGFGTLSENCLTTALDAMEALQTSGKLIGVISHVPQVKERIPTQIRVIKVRGGSRLELPV